VCEEFIARVLHMRVEDERLHERYAKMDGLNMNYGFRYQPSINLDHLEHEKMTED